MPPSRHRAASAPTARREESLFICHGPFACKRMSNTEPDAQARADTEGIPHPKPLACAAGSFKTASRRRDRQQLVVFGVVVVLADAGSDERQIVVHLVPRED